MTQKTTQRQFTESSSVLYMAFELSSKNWKIGFSTGFGQKPRIRTVTARDLNVLKTEIKLAKKRFHLPEGCKVVSCYEAGRDGFWLHRFLTAEGIENFVVDSASIEVNRRRRRAKTDRLDVGSLLRMLMRYCLGEHKVWSVVQVPSVEDEDRRQPHRELSALEKEKNRTSNRIRGLLATQGIQLPGRADISAGELESLRMWDGSQLPDGLKTRIGRECAHLVFLKEQILTLKRERKNALRSKKEAEAAPDKEMMQQLQKLRAIGPVGAWILVREMFGWRQFKNRRQVGSLSGLTPSPYNSGETSYDQGISKAGIQPVRKIAIELAWCWVRFQPKSKLACWFNERFADAGKKARKVGIVAVARRLLIALWRYLETGVLPEGAELKATA
jgi:transposase